MCLDALSRWACVFDCYDDFADMISYAMICSNPCSISYLISFSFVILTFLWMCLFTDRVNIIDYLHRDDILEQGTSFIFFGQNDV